MRPESNVNLEIQLVSAAIDFCSVRPWERHDFDAFVAVSLPGRPDLLYATIMGAGGQEFGLNIFRGASAPHLIRRQMATGVRNFQELGFFGFALTPLVEIPLRFQEVLRRAGIERAPSDLVPYFLASTAVGLRRLLDAQETEALIAILRAVIRLDRTDSLKPRRLRAHRLQKLILSGSLLDPDIETGIDVIGPPPRRSRQKPGQAGAPEEP